MLFRSEKEELERRVEELSARVRSQEARLAPLDDLAAQRRLQLALAKLAQESDVEMESFKLIDETGRGPRDEQLAPTMERLRTALDNEFKRPLYLFSARASYRGLMQVLDGRRGAFGVETARTFVRRWTAVPGSSRALGWDTMLPTSSCGTRLSPGAFGHTGFTGTSLWIDPAKDLYVVLLTNRVHPTRDNDQIGGVRRALHDAVAAEMEMGR